MANSYTVIIRTSLQTDSMRSGAREHASILDQMTKKTEQAAKQQLAAFDKAEREKITASRTAARDIARMERERAQIMAQNERAISAAAKAENQQRTREFKRGLNQMLADLKKTTAEMARSFAQFTRQIGDGMQRAGRSMRNVGLILSASITAPLVLATREAIQFESAFAGVIKTVNASPAELAVLRQALRDLAKEIPVSANELAELGEAAGQLGVKTKDILEFTRVMAALGVTTNITSVEAGTALARFANIIANEAGPQFDRIGAAIVDLGNNSATTEREIVEMGLRIAGAGKTIGLTEAQILSMAAALSSVGIEAEAGGTAISRVMVDIAKSVKAGGKELAAFSDVAGLSAAEFKIAFERDAAGAILIFIQGLGKIIKEGGNAFAVLEELGLDNVRVRDALLRAAGAGDLFSRTLEIGNKAWQENNALTKEAAQRYATTASQLAILKNRVIDLAISLGENFLATIAPIIPFFRRLTTAVDEFVKRNPDIAKAASVMIALAATLGPILAVLGVITIALGATVTAFGSLAGAVGAAAAAVGGAGPLIGVAAAALVALGAVTTTVIAGVALLQRAWQTNMGGIRETTFAVLGEVRQFANEIVDQIVTWWRANLPLIKQTVQTVLNEIRQFWQEHGDKILFIVNAAWQATKAIITVALDVILAAIRIAMQLINKDASGALGTFAGLFAKAAISITKIMQNLPIVIAGVGALIGYALMQAAATAAKHAVALGVDLVLGVERGIRSQMASLMVTVYQLGTRPLDTLRQLWKTQSPSKVFFEIGVNAINGLVLGLQSGASRVDSTLVDLLDLEARRYTKQPRKPAESAAKQIADALKRAADAARELAGKDTAIEKLNRLLSDPNVVRRIDERTIALLRQAAAMEDAVTATRPRRAIGDLTRPRRAGLDIGGAIRDRRVGAAPLTRERQVSDPFDLEVNRAYSSIIADLNRKIGENIRLTQAQIVVQQLEAAGLSDLTDARAQEAIAIAQVIDQQRELEETRRRISDFAFDVSDIFGFAVQEWDGTFRGFFQSIRDGFSDLWRRIVADLIQSAIYTKLRSLLEGIFTGKPGGVSGGSTGGGLFGGLGNIAQSIFGRGTPGFGFAGGTGAAAGGILPGSTVSLSGILGALPGGTITAPGSLSGAAASQGALGQILAQAGAGATGGALGVGGSLGAAFGPLLPLLGAGIGASLGGGSRFGSILGGAGGLLAGGIGAAFLTPGLFAAGGAFGSLGPALGAFLTSPVALVAAPLLIFGAIMLGRAATRRREEAERDRLREEAYAQLNQLLELAKRGQLDPATAGIQAQLIVDQYYQAVSQFRTGSVRRSAENFRPFFNQRVQAIVEASKGAVRRQEIASKLIPSFQHGGLVPFRQNDLTLIKVRPQEKLIYPSGLSSRVPGIDRGVDTVYTYAPAGTAVIPPNVPGYASGGTVGAGEIHVHIELAANVDIEDVFVKGGTTTGGQKLIVHTTRKAAKNGQFN